jgi:hypothetical protein
MQIRRPAEAKLGLRSEDSAELDAATGQAKRCFQKCGVSLLSFAGPRFRLSGLGLMEGKTMML